MSRSRELVKQVLEIPGRIEVKRNGTTWKSSIRGLCSPEITNLAKVIGNSTVLSVICCFLSQNHLPPPPSHIPKDRPSQEKPHHFEEPLRPPPLKRLKKRRHQKVKSRWGVKVPIGSTSSGQLSNCRSTKRSWILKSSHRVEGVEELARNLRGGDRGCSLENWDNTGSCGFGFFQTSGGFEVISKKTAKLSKQKKINQPN